MKMYNLSFLFLFSFLFSCNQAVEIPKTPGLSNNLQNKKSEKTGTANIVFRSADGGETWQDISNGLPEPAKDEYAYGRNAFFTDDNGLWLANGNGLYYTQQNFTAPFWTKAFLPGVFSNLTPSKNGIFAYNYQNGIFEKANGTNEWSPVFTDFKDKRVRSMLQTAAGTLLVSTDNGLYKSTDNGKNWKLFSSGSLGSKTVESNGVLLTGGSQGIMRSTDDGEHWYWVIREGGVGIDVANINGGFAAINYSSPAKTRRIRTSYDGGQTWQPIDAGFPGQAIIESPFTPIHAGTPVQNSNDSGWHPKEAAPTVLEYKTSVIQVGENFFCGHTDGIYKTSNKGKTWKLVFPSVKGKMFKLVVAGNVIYAIQMENHC